MVQASIDIHVVRDIDRGPRRPGHNGLVAQQPRQFLRPWCVAPVRPGETLRRVSVMGDTMLDSVVQWNNLPMTFAEIGLWYVPFSRMPDWMRQIIIGTGYRYLNLADITGITAAVAQGATAAEIAAQGHTTPGLQAILRGWAGEVGGPQAGPQASESVYAPFASHGTYAIAEDWYDLVSNDYDNAVLMSNEPVLSEYTRGATSTNFDVGLAGLDPDPSAVTSLADLIEQLFLLSSSELSWPEYLALAGVDPRQSDHMTHPIMIRHGFVGPMGDGHLVHGAYNAFDNDLQSDSFTSTRQVEGDSDDATSMEWDARIIGQIGQRWNGSVSPGLRFDQPGFIVGTIAWWNELGSAGNYGHMFDATRLTHPGHWGIRQGGGVEEEDFLATQDLYDVTGGAIQDGADSGQTGTGSSVMNMMNLYLHGETAAPLGTDFFRFRGPYGREIPDGLNRMSSRLRAEFDIMSDLVA